MKLTPEELPQCQSRQDLGVSAARGSWVKKHLERQNKTSPANTWSAPERDRSTGESLHVDEKKKADEKTDQTKTLPAKVWLILASHVKRLGGINRKKQDPPPPQPHQKENKQTKDPTQNPTHHCLIVILLLFFFLSAFFIVIMLNGCFLALTKGLKAKICTHLLWGTYIYISISIYIYIPFLHSVTLTVFLPSLSHILPHSPELQSHLPSSYCTCHIYCELQSHLPSSYRTCHIYCPTAQNLTSFHRKQPASPENITQMWTKSKASVS